MSKILNHCINDDRNNGRNRGSSGGDDSSASSGRRVLMFENPIEEYRLAAQKIELPLFDGRDPVGSITRAETYLEVQNISNAVKVKLAKLNMEGATIHWFNLLRETEDHLSWSIFKQALIERYGGCHFDNPFEKLSDLRQGGSMDDYIAEFEYLSSQVGRLPEEQYLGYFMEGLRLEIQRRVRTFNPQTRPQMVRVACDVETKLYRVNQEGKEAESCFQNHDKGFQ